MRVLITGGCGNLGRYVAEEFLTHGHTPVLFDRVSPAESSYPFQTPATFIRGELLSLADCIGALRESGAEAIVHLGAIPFPTDHPDPAVRALGPRAGLPDDATFRINTLGTYYLLDAARTCHVSRLAMASTYFVLGLGFRISDTQWRVAYLPIDEQHPTTPEDSYSLSKLIDELTLAAYTRAWGIRTTALRLLGVWYPHRQRELPRGYFGGQASLDRHFDGWMYLDARDAAQAFRLAIERDDVPSNAVYFVATDSRLGEPARDAITRLYPTLAEQAAAMQPDDLPISFAAATHSLGYEPHYSWRTQPDLLRQPGGWTSRLSSGKALLRRLQRHGADGDQPSTNEHARNRVRSR